MSWYVRWRGKEGEVWTTTTPQVSVGFLGEGLRFPFAGGEVRIELNRILLLEQKEDS